jgi:predicted heme/steroid binding protein
MTLHVIIFMWCGSDIMFITVPCAGLIDQTRAAKCKKYLSENSADETFGAYKGKTGGAYNGYQTKGGSYYTAKKVGSVQDCFKKCAKSSKCGSFTYTPSKKYCTLSKRDVAHSSGEVSKNSVKVCQKSGRYAGYISSGGGSSSSGGGSSSGGITMDQVKSKRWTVVDGKVYDLTSFARIHPGGSGSVTRYFGKDATRAFNKESKHGAPERAVLKTFLVGNLA